MTFPKMTQGNQRALFTVLFLLLIGAVLLVSINLPVPNQESRLLFAIVDTCLVILVLIAQFYFRKAGDNEKLQAPSVLNYQGGTAIMKPDGTVTPLPGSGNLTTPTNGNGTVTPIQPPPDYIPPQPAASKPVASTVKALAYGPLIQDAPQTKPTVDTWYNRVVTQPVKLPKITNGVETKNMNADQLRDWRRQQAFPKINEQLEEVFPHDEYTDTVRLTNCNMQVTADISTNRNVAMENWRNQAMALWDWVESGGA